MSGHDFEKNVQQKMEDLRLSPSDAVWSGVEKEIKKDKRKRRVLLLLPMALLLGLGAYWAMQNSGKPGTIETAQKPNSNDTKNSVTDPAAVSVPPSRNSEQAPRNTDPLIAKDNVPQPVTVSPADDKNLKNREGAVAPNFEGHSNKPAKSVMVSDRGRPLKNMADAKRNSSGKAPKKGPLVKSAIVAPDAPVADSKIDKQAKDVADKDIQSNSEDKAAVVVTSDSLKEEQPSPIATDSPITQPSPAIQKAAAKKAAPSHKWQFGFQGGAGVSKLAKGIDAFDKSIYMDVASGLNSASPPQTPARTYIPASIGEGFSWNAGVFAQRSISNQLKLSAALQYSLYTTNSNVGARVDSLAVFSNNLSNTLLVSRYYRTGNNTNYVSRYHLIELPLTLHWQINKGNRLPVSWNNGLSIAYLSSSNALNYDGSTGYYYKDSRLFNKMQYGFHSGFSITLFHKSKHPLELGPQFNYKFSNILKSDSDPRNLLSGSLLLRWYLRK